jgi:hypothetical protein
MRRDNNRTQVIMLIVSEYSVQLLRFMDRLLNLHNTNQKFAVDDHSGKISRTKLKGKFGKYPTGIW